MGSQTRDWDASTYDEVSAPQLEWAGAVIDRLGLTGRERVLDAGCGSGRVTELLVRCVPDGRVVGVDGSPSMVELARRRLGERADLVVSDLLGLGAEAIGEPVDAVFSNAVFHWVLDHDALFTALASVMRPGARLEAQCGGSGNVASFKAAAAEVGRGEPFREHLAAMGDEWNFASPEETEERLRRSGFSEARCWLEQRPTVPPEPREYLRSVCCGPYLEHLPQDLHGPFVDSVLALMGDPPTLDYVRLNISAVRG